LGALRPASNIWCIFRTSSRIYLKY